MRKFVEAVVQVPTTKINPELAAKVSANVERMFNTMGEFEEIIKDIEKLRLRLIAANKKDNRYENAAANDHLCSSVWWIEKLLKNKR